MEISYEDVSEIFRGEGETLSQCDLAWGRTKKGMCVPPVMSSRRDEGDTSPRFTISRVNFLWMTYSKVRQTPIRPEMEELPSVTELCD